MEGESCFDIFPLFFKSVYDNPFFFLISPWFAEIVLYFFAAGVSMGCLDPTPAISPK